MTFNLDPAELRPLIASIVNEVLVVTTNVSARVGADRLAYLEPEAAALLGLKPHQLRDARRRGELTATKAAGRIAYEKAELVDYHRRQREAVR